MPESRSRVSLAIGALLSLAAVGTFGYRLIEGWDWFDCFYMTLITLATIGYSEPHGITLYGRYFTAFLIVGGVGTVGYALTAIAQSIVAGEIGSALEKRRLQKAIEKLHDHFIICGAGRVGLRVARELARVRVPALVVEQSFAVSERLAEEGMLILAGDATDEDVLRRAHIEKARGLVCALPSDAENVYITLTARHLCPEVYIVARVNDEAAAPKMRKAGANRIISPIATGAHQITQALLRPAVADFIDIATKTEGLDLVIEEIRIAPGSVLSGKVLRDSDIRAKYDVILISIMRASGETLFNPTGETVLRAGDIVIAIGKMGSVTELAKIAASAQAATP